MLATVLFLKRQPSRNVKRQTSTENTKIKDGKSYIDCYDKNDMKHFNSLL